MALAPAKLPIELRESADGPRRFRLSSGLSPERIAFAEPLPFEESERLFALFRLPGESTWIQAHGLVQSGKRELRLVNVAPEEQARLAAYHKERLSLP